MTANWIPLMCPASGEMSGGRLGNAFEVASSSVLR